MKKAIAITIIILIVLVVLGGGSLLLFLSGLPKQKDFQHLTSPRIVEKEDINALVIDFKGDPNIVLKEAYKKLYSTYYQLKKVPKGANLPASVARYYNFKEIMSKPQEKKFSDFIWQGNVALPLPDDISTLPEKAKKAPYPVKIRKYSYGTVAEVVHFGPYEEEYPVINQLLQFIEGAGYEVSGYHEEEYIKGPGIPLVSPKDYITIIRYQIKKK
ncbi:MAG: GyrI-like domain-containing protein [Spirochaetes bacterium]|nr:GyrI-like domain-containing protein [Spirochaetota bacterium]